MSFDAGEQVEPLDYDFTAYVEGELGRIEEPTSVQVELFQHNVVQILQGSGIDKYTASGDEEHGTNDFSFDQLDDIMQKSSDVNQKVLGAVADLTGIAQGSIDALPFRVQRAFSGWIMGKFFRPED